MEKVLRLPVVSSSELPVQSYHSPRSPMGQPPGKTLGSHSLYTQNLGDLNKLVFSEDALSALATAPAPNSYASAYHTSKKLFDHQTLSVPVKGAGRRKAAKIGRHNARGSGSKHLPCHLTQSLPYGKKGGGPEGVRGYQSAGVSVKDHRRTCHMTAREDTYHYTEQLSPLSCQDGDLEHMVAVERGIDQASTVTSAADPKAFIEHLAAGAKPVHLPRGTPSTILLDDNALFKKVLQRRFPPPPDELAERDTKKAPAVEITSRQPLAFLQGQRRWLDLPQLVKPSEEMPWECMSIDGPSGPHLPSVQTLSEHSSHFSTSEQHPNQEFFNIMREWRNRWELHIRLKDVGADRALLQEMRSVSDRSRMLAVAAVSMLAENEAKLLEPQPLAFGFELAYEPWKGRKVSRDLMDGLEDLLDDGVIQVQVACAVVLYSMDRQGGKAEEVLLSVLSDSRQQRSASERWAAAQTLVSAGVVSASIVEELLSHLLNSYNPRHQAKAARLLAVQSSGTNLVHSLLADQLNNSGWRERLAACTVVPLLHHSVNKDLCTKLLTLTWDDWSTEVQHAAAKALGGTSHAKMIHDDIITRLTDDSLIVRLDAIRKLHSLRLMTSKLLPSFLACFDDKHLSIRMEAVAVSGSLKLAHQQVLKALKRQLQDNCWMLKIATLQALAEIGHSDEELAELLIWAVRFEKVPMVRAEACRTIGELGLNQEKVIGALKDLVTVDDDVTVVEQAMETLARLGHTERVRDVMMDEVCEAVKRLGTKETITSKVVAADTSRTVSYGMQRPTEQLAIRDYLDDKQRYLMYGPKSERRKAGHTNWSPDTKTINAQLEKMKRRVRSCTM